MHKITITKGFLLSLLCFIFSTAVMAQDINVTPTLNSEDEVCIFLVSPDADATYYLWAWGDGYTPSATRGDYPGNETFVKLGRQFDGTYLYKWTRPADDSGIPSQFVLQKGNGDDAVKLLDGGSYVNHGIYRVVTEIQNTDVITLTKRVTDIDAGTYDEAAAANDHTVYFETPRKGTVWVWPYNTANTNENFVGSGWQSEAAKMTQLKQLDNGNWLYKWTQPVSIADTANVIIFSPKYDGTGQYGDVNCVNHGYYTNTVSSQSVTTVRQFGQAYVSANNAESPLDPKAVLQSPEEVSVFLESPDENATYYIWPYDGNGHEGDYFTETGWPGATLTKVGQLSDGNYLYKWTQNSHISDVPTSFTISKNGGGEGNKIYADKPFINHGYFIESATGTVSASNDVVTRQADGSFATNRTTYGKRVIYEMNVGSFAGNFQNAQKQLSNLKNLGIDVIWLMPIYERGKSIDTKDENNKSPYAVKDFEKINPAYGTMDDLKNFVTAAHLLGMDVWLDFVPNHTALDNVWADPNSSNFHPEYYQGYNATTRTDTTGFVHPKSGNVTFYDVYQLDYKTETTETDANGNTTYYNPADRAIREVLEYWVKNADIDGYRFDMVSSTEIPDAVWTHLTSALKAIKPSMQFLAEADLSGGDGTRITASNFQYDYAWWFNDKLRAFGKSTNTYQATNEDKTSDDYNPAADPKDLAHITRSFLLGTNNVNVDRMVYLTNHDKNWNDTPKTMADTWGDNRYAMTVYEFTMPGMPLVYNGQEQNGTVAVDYFHDSPIDWSATSDYKMLGLIQELAHLKHTNNALNDANNATQRGETRLLNAFNHNILAYERVNGDEHVLVVLNLSGSDVSTTILGATPGDWNLYLSGNSVNGLTNPNQSRTITDNWYLENIPAHGYMVFTYTGESLNANTGIYIVTEDSKDNPTQHQMSFLNSDDNYNYYQFVIKKEDFAGLNTDGDDLKFTFQEFYDFLGTVCRKEQAYGAGSNANAQFKSTNTTAQNKFNFTTNTNDANNSFSISDQGNDDIVKFIVTFARSKANSDAGYVTVQFVSVNDILEGYYLITPLNINETDTKKTHQWRFNNANEDPASVSDKYLKDLNEDKTELCSYVIDANDFDSYIPADRKAGNTIQFRVRQYSNNDDVRRNGKITDVCPSKADMDNAKSTFDGTKDNASNIYGDANWEPTAADGGYDGYFKILYQPDVAKYIIQLWKTGAGSDGKTKVRVYYVRKFNYKGSTIEDISASNEDVYLYNVDAQKFLYVGNTWGTMASLLYDDLGTRLNISEGITDDNSEFKLIKTRLDAITTVPNGHMLGIDDFSYDKNSTDPFINLDEANIYCDRDNGNRWLIEKADNLDYANTYTLRLYDVKDGRFHYMLADHSDGNSDADKITNSKVKYVAQDVTYVAPSQLRKPENLKGEAEVKGGNRVVYIGDKDKGHIEYTYHADQAGTYEVNVAYIFNRPAELTVKVGDQVYTQDTKNTGTQQNVNRQQWLRYRVHLDEGDNLIKIAEQQEMSPNITGFNISIWRPDDLSYGRWQFVTYKDLVAKLKNENADLYGGTSADATFLLTDQGFTRYVTVTWNNDNGSTLDDGSTSNVVLTKNTIGDNPVNGMYWNGHITGKGHIYQDVDVPMYGVYTYDAYGFYHGSETDMYYQYATAFNDDGSVKSWSDPAYIPLKEETGKTYNGRNTDIETGKLFYNESVLSENPEHKTTQYIYVPQNAPMYNDNYKIRIGFYKKGDATTDYTAVDDVHLHYNGKSTFILDENWTKEQSEDALKPVDRTNVPVYLKRTFWKGEWNTLVLPVSVSTASLRSIFGDDVQVATPYGLDEDDPYLIRFTILDLKSGSNAIEPNRFYIVKPGKLVGTHHVIDLVTNDGGKTYTPVERTIDASDKLTQYYPLGSYDLNKLTKEPVDMDVNTLNFNAGSAKHPDHNTIRIHGNYYQDEAPMYSYVFSNYGDMVYLNSRAMEMKGFRFFITDDPKKQGSSSMNFAMGSINDDLDAVLASFSNKDNGGETTGINGVTTVNGNNSNVNDGNVYDLSGRLVAVNGETDKLPKGVYIINGRKFIKR